MHTELRLLSPECSSGWWPLALLVALARGSGVADAELHRSPGELLTVKRGTAQARLSGDRSLLRAGRLGPLALPSFRLVGSAKGGTGTCHLSVVGGLSISKAHT